MGKNISHYFTIIITNKKAAARGYLAIEYGKLNQIKEVNYED
ncbi:hypothetical protein [Persephonella sp.]